MKLRHPSLIRLIALLGSWFIRLWMGTMRFRFAAPDGSFHPPDPDQQRFIYTFWHEMVLFPVTLTANARVCTLISKHADGELIPRTCLHLAIATPTGSTTHSG